MLRPYRAPFRPPPAGAAGRKPLVAVGSNAAPAQLARKLAGVPGRVPVLRARLDDLGIGFAAQLSRPGYVPWAPVRRPGARTAAHVMFLTPAQLAAVDATEPSYTRVSLPAGTVVLAAGIPVGGAEVYRSRYGVVANLDVGERRPGAHPYGQAAAADALLGRLPGFTAGSGLRTSADLAAAAPIPPPVAAAFRAALRAAGLVTTDGL